MRNFPASKHLLPFTLLAEPGGAVAKKYDSLRNLLVFKIAKRNSFIIDPQGNIAKIYRNASPKVHIYKILMDLQVLQSK